MSVVFKAFSVEKCLPSKEGVALDSLSFCPVAIGLVNRINKHYIHVAPFGAISNNCSFIKHDLYVFF